MSDIQGAEGSPGAEGATQAAIGGGDMEAAARRMGWRPKEEYKGDPTKWVEADAFVERVQDEVPRLKRTLSDMDQKFARLEKAFKEQTEVLTDFREFASRGEQRAYERALSDLTTKRQIAVASADVDGFNAVEAEIKKLNADTKPATTAKPAAEVETPKPPPTDPAITAFIDANPWFNADGVLNATAKALDADLMAQFPGMPLAERLAKVKAEVQSRFPEKFGNTRRDAPGSVLSPSSPNPGRRSAKSYENLPPEAKKACDKFVKTMPPDRTGKRYTREDYVKDYDWGDA